MAGSCGYEVVKSASGVVVAVLTLDGPHGNALGEGVRRGLGAALEQAASDELVAAIVVTTAGRDFCAGADMSGFGSPHNGPSSIDLCAAVEACAKPVVAAVDGVAFGAGCELAASCHFRVASPRARTGMPEVNLGLVPGSGGTQRLPRLMGVASALDLICSGEPLGAEAALRAGIWDELAPNLRAASVELAASKVGCDLSPRRLSLMEVPAPPPGVFDAKRKQLAAGPRKAELAPLSAVKLVEMACSTPFENGMKAEIEEFIRLIQGPQSVALIHAFFAERQCAKVPGATAEPGPLRSVGIVGAGQMGGGIAMCCAEAGMAVSVVDADQAGLDRGMANIRKNYARSVERGSKTQARVDEIMAHITLATAYSAFAQCDLVIEAVYENMELKKTIFAELDKACPAGCVLGTNTSAQDIDAIASATKRPADVIGIHFFMPANVMRLLENVRGKHTSPRTIATAMAFGKKINKVTCLVGNCPGFLVNRVMGKSSWYDLVQTKGVMPHVVDAASEGYGMKMGPCRLLDLTGVDLVGRERARTGQADPEHVVIDALYAAGRHGQKTGKGFYKYDEKRRLSRDPEGEAILRSVWDKTGVKPAELSEFEVVDRLYLPVANEGFNCLMDGIAMRASDIDACVMHSMAWPRHQGGPMRWATSIGLPTVLQRLRAMDVKPSPLLEECAEKGWTLDSPELTSRVSDAWERKWSRL